MWIEKWQIEVDHKGTIQMPMGKKIIGIPCKKNDDKRDRDRYQDYYRNVYKKENHK